MRHELSDQVLRDLLSAARGAPRPGLEARALAALAGVHPRRRPNLLTIVIMITLLLLLTVGVFAAVRHFFYVEGTLHFHDLSYASEGGWGDRSARFFAGEAQWRTEGMDTIRGDISPVSDEIVFQAGPWPGPPLDIFKYHLPDHSGEVNLTEAAGVGGVNCLPKWSPDGTMIAFLHCDPVEGMDNCEAGFHVWVMNTDGTDAHRITPEGTLPTIYPSWSPDGSRLLILMSLDEEQYGSTCTMVTDIWGTSFQVLPNVGSGAVWSPDGSMIASIKCVEDQVHGQPGQWNQLLLTNADGSDPRVLVQQFIAYAQVEASPAVPMSQLLPSVRSARIVVTDLGPHHPQWSPKGDKIAFLAAPSFDPDGVHYMQQIEVWVYDLTTDELIRVTDDDVSQESLMWKQR